MRGALWKANTESSIMRKGITVALFMSVLHASGFDRESNDRGPLQEEGLIFSAGKFGYINIGAGLRNT